MLGLFYFYYLYRKPLTMKKFILLVSIFIFCICEAKDTTRIKTNVLSTEELREYLSSPQVNRNESLGMDAAMAGYGTSRFDKHINYTTQEDLYAKRELLRKEEQKNIMITIAIVVSVVALILFLYQKVRRATNEKAETKKKLQGNWTQDNTL